MHRVLRMAIALAVVASGSSGASSDGGMRLLAKETPRITVAIEGFNSALTSNGADMEAVRNQTELAIRRCGFAINETPHKAVMRVNAAGVLQEGRGYFGTVLIQVWIWERVRGEFVFINAWTEMTLFAGPPGTAGEQIRNAVAGLLDQFCNEYLKARDEVRGKSRAREQK